MHGLRLTKSRFLLIISVYLLFVCIQYFSILFSFFVGSLALFVAPKNQPKRSTMENCCKYKQFSHILNSINLIIVNFIIRLHGIGFRSHGPMYFECLNMPDVTCYIQLDYCLSHTKRKRQLWYE